MIDDLVPAPRLRDNFGAHTYRRTDREGTFHTLWAGDLTEKEMT